jgi:hypothetical protein
MCQITLTIQPSFEKFVAPATGNSFCGRWNRWFLGLSWKPCLYLIIPRWATGASRKVSVLCCTSTFCDVGAACWASALRTYFTVQREEKIYGDSGYQGQMNTIHEAASTVQNMTSLRAKI